MPSRRSIRQSNQVIPGQPFEWQGLSGDSANDRRAFAILRELETGKIGTNSDGSIAVGGSSSGGGTATFPNWVDGDFGIGAPPPADHRLHVEDVTNPATSYAITGITQAASAVITIGAGHTVVVGVTVMISGVAGMTEINGLSAAVTATGATTITVAINSTAFTAYASGGTAAIAAGSQQFYFTIDTQVNSGLRGLRLRKAAANTEPIGLTLEYESGPVWDTIALDASSRDLVLAYSHTLKADNLRLRDDSAQMAFGRVVGQPASGGGQFQIQSGVGAAITGITNAVNAVITVATTLGFRVGDTVGIKGITAPAGMAAGINGTTATVAALTATTITTTFDTSPYAAWSAGGSIYVSTAGVTITQWDNQNNLLLLQGLPDTVTRRTKVQFGQNGPQMGSDAAQNGTNDWWLFHGSVFAQYVSSAGLVHIGGSGSAPTPTAKLHLGAGAAAASGAPLKLTSGTNLTAAEAGAVEYDGTELYFTRASARLKVLLDTPVDGTNITLGTTTGLKLGTATTQKLGFWNATPVVRGAAWTPTNVTTDRSFDANATTLDEIADALGTLIAELQTMGLLS